MKRFKQMLAVLLCAVALCGLAPAALAAQPLDESENGGKVIIYFETCGGTGIPVVERTSGDGKLYSLPTPTMEGYTFKGWYTDIVGGDAIVAGETEFRRGCHHLRPVGPHRPARDRGADGPGGQRRGHLGAP